MFNTVRSCYPLYAMLYLLIFTTTVNGQANQPTESIPFGRNPISFEMGRDTVPKILSAKYDSVRKFHNGLAAVKRNNAWGFINESGKEIIPVEYERVNDFIEVATTVLKNGEWLVIKSTGKKLRKLIEDRVELPGTAVSNTPGSNNLLSGVLQSSASGVCPPNLDFEFGNFQNWACFAGNVTSRANVNYITVAPSSPIVNRHEIYSTSATGALDVYGGFPVKPPGGSAHALKLGNSEVGGNAERVRYAITVPNDPDYSITFQYAVVMENPDVLTTGVGHADWEQPRFTAKLYDPATGEYLPCASFTYVASFVPGFLNSPKLGNGGSRVKYKPWSSVYVNLSKYQGRTLVLDFTTTDCTLFGHFGYAYIDVVECGIGARAQYTCAPPNITTLSSPDGFQTYQWYNNDFTTALGSTQNITLNPGPALNSIFKVIVKPFNNTDCSVCDCSDTLTVKVVASLPGANAGVDQTTCGSGTSTFLGTSPVAGHSYSWSPTSYLSNPNSSAPITTTPVSTFYTLTVTTDSSGCSAKDTVFVNVYPKPTASFSVIPNQCLTGNNFVFNNTSTISNGALSFLWTFDDGSTSTLANPVHSFATAGSFNVRLVVTGNFGCKDSMIQTIRVYPMPISNWNVSATQCLNGNSFSFSNNSSALSGPLSYTWFFGDGTTSLLTTPVHSYATSGTYNVNLVVTSNNGCQDSLNRQLIVNPNPLASFNASGDKCLNGNKFTFSNNSTTGAGAMSYSWTFGDGAGSTINSPSHSFSLPGTYNVKLLVTANSGCKDSLTKSVKVFEAPLARFATNDSSQCFTNNDFVFSNASTISNGIINNFWSFGDGDTSVAVNPSHFYTTRGNFTVKLIVTSDKFCKDSLSLPVIVKANPNVDVNVNKNISLCLGNSVNLGVTGGLTYNWSPINDLTCSSCPNPLATPGNNISYVVSGVGPNGCPGYDTVHITVIKPFVIRATGDTICLRDTAYLKATGATSFNWSPTSTLSCGIAANPLAFPSVTTQYRVVGYDGFNCFTDTAFITVMVARNPMVDLGNPLQLSTGTLKTLTPFILNGPVQNWVWSPATNLSCTTCPAPVVTVKKDITYHLNVTNVYGCSGTDSVKISAFCQSSQIFIPNAFTPDGDGINDFLMVRGKGIIKVNFFRIFNRWGELIFERTNFIPNDPLFGWNGKIRGVAGPPDVFVYTTSVVCENGMSYTFKGNVSVIK